MPVNLHTFETPKACVSIRNDDIIIIEFKENMDIEKVDVMEIQEKIGQLINHNKTGVLVIPGKNSTNAPEAREYSASREGSKHSIARAILVNSFPEKLIARIYINFHKPVLETRFFENKDKAIGWLKSMIK